MEAQGRRLLQRLQQRSGRFALRFANGVRGEPGLATQTLSLLVPGQRRASLWCHAATEAGRRMISSVNST